MASHKSPLISVVMPSFNASTTIAAAIESIQIQTFRDWEFVVVDDGSTDETTRVVRDFQEKDGRIRLIERPHKGIVESLIAGCSEAQGDFIARMDADDITHPQRFEMQIKQLETDPRIALCGTQVRMTGENVGYGRRRYESWINSLCDHDAIVRELFVECPIPHPTFMIRRSAFDRVGGYQEHGWAEDYDLCMRLFEAGDRFGKAPSVLLDWTESPKRLSMTSDRYSPEQFRALKRHYLFRTYLREPRPIIQWGAGEVGKRWLREWTELRPSAVVDIHPRKIGRAIHGYRIISPEELPPPGAAFILVAVGALTARKEIREWLEPRGYRELKDYLFLA